MATYLGIVKSVEKVFANGFTVKTGDTIKVYPANYQGKISGNEWIRLNVLPEASVPMYGGQRTDVLININIFVPAGQGIRRAAEIADAIDALFLGNILDGDIQVTNSYLTTLGVDPINKGLYRIDWNGSFRKY